MGTLDRGSMWGAVLAEVVIVVDFYSVGSRSLKSSYD